MGHEETRKYRIDFLLTAIKRCNENERPADEKKLKAYYSVEWGTCAGTMNDYLDVLIDGGFVERKDGLWVTEQQKKADDEVNDFFDEFKDAK